MNDYVATPDLRITLVIARLCWRFQKNYAYPKYKTIQAQVLQLTGRSISIRSLARHLGAIVRDGWLERRRRHRTAPDGSLQLHSTLYICTARTRRWLANLGATWWITSTAARNALIPLAVPVLADTPKEETYFYNNRAARAPPKK